MSTPPPSPLLDDPRLTTMGLLMEVHAGLRSATEPDLEVHGLSWSAFDVLIRLSRSPDLRLRMSQLADQTTLSNSGLTRVVDRLLDAGLVQRVRDHDDKRVYHAVITPAGLTRVVDALPSHLALIQRSLTGLIDPADLVVFERVLRTVRAVVKPGADPSDPVAPPAS